jgi:hypothetical protein
MANRKISSFTNGDKTTTVYWNSDDREFVVKLRGRPQADYFTTDKADAIGTAMNMVGLRPAALGDFCARKR